MKLRRAGGVAITEDGPTQQTECCDLNQPHVGHPAAGTLHFFLAQRLRPVDILKRGSYLPG